MGKDKQMKTIGIVGFGIIGQALVNWLKANTSHKLLISDPLKGMFVIFPYVILYLLIFIFQQKKMEYRILKYWNILFQNCLMSLFI